MPWMRYSVIIKCVLDVRFMCVSWLYYVYCIPIAYSFHGYFIDVTWLFYLCLIAVLSPFHFSFILV